MEMAVQAARSLDFVCALPNSQGPKSSNRI